MPIVNPLCPPIHLDATVPTARTRHLIVEVRKHRRIILADEEHLEGALHVVDHHMSLRSRVEPDLELQQELPVAPDVRWWRARDLAEVFLGVLDHVARASMVAERRDVFCVHARRGRAE